MNLNMAANLIIMATIIFICCPISDQKLDVVSCKYKCNKPHAQALKRGEPDVCIDFIHEGGDLYHEPLSKCMVECMEFPIFEDQNDCLCRFCKDEDFAKGFCTAPGAGSIKQEECDSLVCTGKAHHFGNRTCQPQ